jgi:hypothetical protein
MIAEGRVARPVEDGDDDGAHALDPVRAGLGPGDEGEAAQRPLALPAGQVPQEGEPAQAPARQERPRLVGPPIEGAGEGAAVEVVRGAGREAGATREGRTVREAARRRPALSRRRGRHGQGQDRRQERRDDPDGERRPTVAALTQVAPARPRRPKSTSAPRGRVLLRGLGRGHGLLEVLQAELELVRVEPLRAPAEPPTLQLPDQEPQLFDLGLRRVVLLTNEVALG